MRADRVRAMFNLFRCNFGKYEGALVRKKLCGLPTTNMYSAIY